MGVSEWVEYQACPREVRHLRLGDEPCRLCLDPVRADRALTSAGKFHWLTWQQRLAWTERHRPDAVLALGSADFVAWAERDPAGHRRYAAFLAAAATFTPGDIARPTRGWVLAAGARPMTVILRPDGTIDRPERPEPPGAARWGCDPAGVLVLYLDRAQYRIVGQRDGLHTGRRVRHGATAGEPVFLGLWSDLGSGLALRLTDRSATVLLERAARTFAERDLFVGAGPRGSVLGPEDPAALELHDERRVSYVRGRERVALEGGPVFRGAGEQADWRLAFLRRLG